MRTITDAQTVALTSSDRASYARVKVHDTSSWIDLTDHLGIDWLLSVEYGETQDGRAVDATFVMQTADHSLNASPGMTGNLVNATNTLIALGNQVQIDAAIMPMGQTPGAADWMEVFQGKIDSYQVSAEKITVRCRDQSIDPSDAFVEEETEYGDGATGVEEIIQDLLDDWPMPDGATYLTLYSENGTAGTPFNAGDVPGWNIKKYRQKREPVYDAIRTLAGTLGWDLRYRWQTNTSSYELVMWEPDRAAVGGVARTFSTDEYYSIDSISLDQRTIRNVCRVSYTDGSTGNRTSYDDTDAASIAKYGRRWCEIAEGESSQIDSSTEATTLAQACVDDLKEPTLTISMTMPYFPWAELQDYYTIEANDVHFDANQTAAVISIRHTIGKGQAITSLTLEGKPKGRRKRYLATQQRPVRRTLDNTNVVVYASQGNLCPNGDFSGWDGQ